MNCREAQQQIFTERDGALSLEGRTALDGHLAHCDACRKIRADLAAALVYWKTEADAVAVPDGEREWHAVRRKIRGADVAPRSRLKLLSWVALPLGIAAAVAFVILRPIPPSDEAAAAAVPQVARVDSVETPGNNASTMVIVDQKSGWLIVWASDGKSG